MVVHEKINLETYINNQYISLGSNIIFYMRERQPKIIFDLLK